MTPATTNTNSTAPSKEPVSGIPKALGWQDALQRKLRPASERSRKKSGNHMRGVQQSVLNRNLVLVVPGRRASQPRFGIEAWDLFQGLIDEFSSSFGKTCGFIAALVPTGARFRIPSKITAGSVARKGSVPVRHLVKNRSKRKQIAARV
jgi:hypothetical protein